MRMRRKIQIWAACGFLTLVLAGSALAHHGWTGYDEAKTLTLTGVIREASYENPHSLIKLQVDEGKGKTWLAYLAPPSRMDSRGFAKDTLKVRAERITIGGKTIELR